MKQLNVYLVTCKPTGKMYVGITGIGINARWGLHVSDARNKNKRQKCTALCNAINEYGVAAFSIEVLRATFSKDKLGMLERRYISELNSMFPHGLNLTSGGQKPQSFSAASLKKLSDSARVAANRRYENEDQRKASAEMMKRRYEEIPHLKAKFLQGLQDSWNNPEKRKVRVEKIRAAAKKRIGSGNESMKRAWADPVRSAEIKQKLRDAWDRNRANRLVDCARGWETRRADKEFVR